MDERIPTGQILGLRGFLLVRYWELADSFGPIPTGQILPSRCSILYCQIFIMKIIIVPFIILTPPPRLTLGISRFLPVRYWQLAAFLGFRLILSIPTGYFSEIRFLQVTFLPELIHRGGADNKWNDPYDPGQAGRDAYRDPAHNTNSKECLYESVYM